MDLLSHQHVLYNRHRACGIDRPNRGYYVSDKKSFRAVHLAYRNHAELGRNQGSFFFVAQRLTHPPLETGQKVQRTAGSRNPRL
jgi:hypothetical protein